VGIETLAKEVDKSASPCLLSYEHRRHTSKDAAISMAKYGEQHLFNQRHSFPPIPAANNFQLFKKYSALINDQ